MKMPKISSGFTIVELLIVIVIVAVLASLTVTAFSGVQQRAERSNIAAMMGQWERAIKLFIADKGARPQANWACIGKAADFPADGNFPAGSCVVRSDDNGATWVVENGVDTSGALLSDQLAPYVSGKVYAPHKQVFMNQSGTIKKQWRGLIYDDATWDGKVTLTYGIQGDCVPGAYRQDAMQGGFECYHSISEVGSLPLAN